MHWVINTNLHREGGYHSLIEQLDHQGIAYTLVRKPPFVDYLVNMDDDVPMELKIDGPVFVSGTTSMKLVSDKMGWSPGYIDSPGIVECIEHWGHHMLNADARFGRIDEIQPPSGRFFIRPDEDSKTFSGEVMDDAHFNDWRAMVCSLDGYTTLPGDTLVMIASLKTIWAEYRCTVVDGRVVTASRYKTGTTVGYSTEVGDRIINFANARVREWNPRIAFTLDIADTPEGLKVIETNALSSSGFYALDMGIFVGEITALGENTSAREPIIPIDGFHNHYTEIRYILIMGTEMQYPVDPLADYDIERCTEQSLEMMEMIGKRYVDNGKAIVEALPENRTGAEFLTIGKQTLDAIVAERARRNTLIANGPDGFDFGTRVEVILIDALFGHGKHPPIGARGVILGSAEDKIGDASYVQFLTTDIGYEEKTEGEKMILVLMNWSLAAVPRS